MNLSDKIKKARPHLIFLLLLGFLFMAYRFPHSIQKGPRSTHMWRQADCYSFAVNYFEEGHKFFQPSIHFIGYQGTGKTVSEFPIIYYMVSFLWEIFGKHTLIFRAVNLLIVFTGLYYLFRFIREFLKDDFWAMYIPMFLFTSPVLVYYSNNFLMNAPAFGLVLIGLFHYHRYRAAGKQGSIYTAMAFFLLAGLLKMTALILFAALLVYNLVAMIKPVRNRLGIPATGTGKLFPAFFIVIGGITLWLIWSDKYNGVTGSGVFLRGILPIWEMGLYNGLDVGTSLYATLLPSLFNRTATIILVALFIWLLIRRKHADKEWLMITSLIAVGILAFILLFYRAFSVHDYYLINLLIIVPLVAMLFLNYLKNRHAGLFNAKPFRTLSGVALFFLLYFAVIQQRIRYDTDDTFIRHTIIVRQNDKAFWRNQEEIHALRFEALETITPYLRGLGIDRTDKVISIPDGSPNITLALMDQKGYTDFGFAGYSGEDRIRYFIGQGARYLVISDPTLESQPYLAAFTGDKIGRYRNVSVYRLPPPG